MKTPPVEKLNSGSVMACSPVLLAGPDQNARRGVACDSPSFHHHGWAVSRIRVLSPTPRPTLNSGRTFPPRLSSP